MYRLPWLCVALLLAAPLSGRTRPTNKPIESPFDAGELGEFGNYRMRLALAKPTFSSDLRFYSKLYGDTVFYPSFGMNYLLWGGQFSTGFGFHASYYTDVGSPAKKVLVDNPTDSEVELAKGRVSLTLVPYQFVFFAQYAPRGKFLFFDTWLGYEELFMQEVRLTEGEAASAENSASPTITTGWTTNLTFGVAGNILLNSLDRKSMASMRRVEGFSRIYFTPFFELATPVALPRVLVAGKLPAVPKLGRLSVGFGLTYEAP